MLKNNSKMAIGKNILICLSIICLMFTAFGLFMDNSFAVDFNDTADEMGLEYNIEDKLENSQNGEVEVDSQDSEVLASDDVDNYDLGSEESSVVDVSSDDMDNNVLRSESSSNREISKKDMDNDVLSIDASSNGDVLASERTPNGQSFKDIQTCVNGANPGDTIVLNGRYAPSTTDSVIIINHELHFRSSSGATLDGQRISSVFRLNNGADRCTFKNLTFINAYSQIGSAILVEAKNVTVENCSFINNHAIAGGILSTDTKLYEGENFKIINCYFKDNAGYRFNLTTDGAAGAVGAFAINSQIINCTFDSNWVRSNGVAYGGAIQVGLDVEGYYGRVENCIFINNRAISKGNSHGGAGCVRNGVEYVNCVFINNSADQGGALTMHAGGNIVNCTFINNEAERLYGGAISTGFTGSYMNLGIINCTFEGNKAPSGGAIYVKGLNVNIIDSDFTNNYAKNYGGALNIVAENVVVENSQFNNNSVDVDGGAIFIKGVDTIIKNSWFESNKAIPDVRKLEDGLGGAIYINSTRAEIINNDFRLNTARNGSAIYYDKNGVNLFLLDNTLYQNQAWVYALPISSQDIEFGETENITVVIYGGNNIGDYDNLAVSNAIYNAADYENIEIDGENPVDGATDSGMLYQDTREYNIPILLEISHEDGTVVYNNSLYSSYLGEIGVSLDDLKPGKYYVSAKHFEDTYYKAISNLTSFRVFPKVDNRIIKSTTSTSFGYEDVVIWTLEISNEGPNDSTNVVVYDVLPDGLVWLNDTCGGRYNHKAGRLDVGDLHAGETLTFKIKTLINKTGDITNRVNITSNETDIDLTNNHDEKTIHVDPACDLKVVKSVSNSNPNYLDLVNWTITVTNRGPDAAHNVEVRDLLPNSLIWMGDDGYGDYNHLTGIWSVGTLNVNDRARLTILCKVNKTGLIENKVTANTSDIDYDLSNNRYQENIFVNPACDLSIEKSSNAENCYHGEFVRWTLVIKNNGPDKALCVIVEDNLPVGFEYVDSDLTKGNYSNGRFNIDEIDAGETVTIDIISKADASGDFMNVANVTSQTPDLDLTNNKDSKSIHVIPICDLRVVKEVSDSEPKRGDKIIWTITVTNNGPDVAHNINVTDLLLDSLIWIGDDSLGSYNHLNGIWKILVLNVDESKTLNIECEINGSGLIQNNVSVKGSELDNNLTNNIANETVYVERLVDLSIVKLVNDSRPNYGDLINWTLVISNKGPDKATNISVEDVLPEGLIFIDYEATKGIYGDGRWVMCCLNSGDVETLNIITKVKKTGRITNMASIHSNETDLDESNNIADESVDVPEAVDLQVSIEADDENPLIGDVVNWIICVKNNGPNGATNIVLEDILPDGLIFDDYSSSKGSYLDDVWGFDSLDVGKSEYLNISTISNGLGKIINRVNVTSDGYDWNTSNNHDDSSIYVYDPGLYDDGGDSSSSNSNKSGNGKDQSNGHDKSGNNKGSSSKGPNKSGNGKGTKKSKGKGTFSGLNDGEKNGGNELSDESNGKKSDGGLSSDELSNGDENGLSSSKLANGNGSLTGLSSGELTENTDNSQNSNSDEFSGSNLEKHNTGNPIGGLLVYCIFSLFALCISNKR